MIMRDLAVEKRLPTLRSSTGSFESMLWGALIRNADSSLMS